MKKDTANKESTENRKAFFSSEPEAIDIAIKNADNHVRIIHGGFYPNQNEKWELYEVFDTVKDKSGFYLQHTDTTDKVRKGTGVAVYFIKKGGLLEGLRALSLKMKEIQENPSLKQISKRVKGVV